MRRTDECLSDLSKDKGAFIYALLDEFLPVDIIISSPYLIGETVKFEFEFMSDSSTAKNFDTLKRMINHIGGKLVNRMDELPCVAVF